MLVLCSQDVPQSAIERPIIRTAAYALMMEDESLQLSFDSIQAATNCFSQDNKIGEGEFGDVYQGLLPNGTQIAVKRLSKCSRQGAQEFKNEIVLIAKLQQRNLVRLLGFCSDGQEMILIYEFIPNKSLDHYLSDSANQTLLNWPKRLMIIHGIARGLLYLHEDSPLKIIHRDLKASNVLLDRDMNPKITDFGTARIVGADISHINTKRVVGTYGYMPPEYVMHGHYSVKSDVYSFGVLVLEIITGKKNESFRQSDHMPDILSYRIMVLACDISNFPSTFPHLQINNGPTEDLTMSINIRICWKHQPCVYCIHT